MKESVILIDMDDVLCDLVNTWIKILNNEYKITIKKEDIITWDIAKAITSRFPKLTSSDIYKPLGQNGLFRNLPIMPEAKQALEMMRANNWKLVIVTSLPVVKCKIGQVVQEKLEWVEEYLKGLINPKDVIITYHKHLINGDILIDDAPHNINSYLGNAIVFDQPWNRSIKMKPRINNWNEAISICKRTFLR